MIVIVGGGFAGIQMLNELVKAGRRDLMLMEATGQIGGIWSVHENGNLRAELCSNIYRIPEFPAHVLRQPDKDDICTYLSRFVDSRDLRRYIYLNTTCVAVDVSRRQLTYATTGGDTASSSRATLSYDYVVDCGGVYTVPREVDVGAESVRRTYQKIHSMHLSDGVLDAMKTRATQKTSSCSVVARVHGSGRTSCDAATSRSRGSIGLCEDHTPCTPTTRRCVHGCWRSWAGSVCARATPRT
jgi:NADH dehydrogenase FAD-containing subunit